MTKYLSLFLFSLVSWAGTCTTVNNFISYVTVLHSTPKKTNQPEVAALTAPGIITLDEVNQTLNSGGLERKGEGDFHTGYKVWESDPEKRISQFQGQIVLVAKPETLTLIQKPGSTYNEVYSVHLARGIQAETAFAEVVKSNEHGVRTLKVISDSEGRPVGRIVTAVGESMKALNAFPPSDRERVMAKVLPTLVDFWAAGFYHGDLRNPNIYAVIHPNGKIEWTLIDFGPTPQREFTDPSQLVGSTLMDRRLVYEQVLGGDHFEVSDDSLAKLLEEIPNYESWASAIAPTDILKYQMFTFTENQKQIQVVYDNLKRTNAPSLWFFVNGINESAKKALENVPASQTETRAVLKKVIKVLTNAVDNNDPKNVDVLYELMALGRSARVEWNGSDAPVLVVYQNHRY